MEHSILERLGIGWNDSVGEANEKRVKEYDRQVEEALDYVETYRKDWEKKAKQVQAPGALIEQRRAYEKGFVTEKGKTQLAVSIKIEEPLRSLLAEAREDLVNCLLSEGSRSRAEEIEDSPTWVPDFAHIQDADLHITVCIPSLWREPASDPSAHDSYNREVGAALRTIAADHEAFVLELDRFLLSKDGSLLGLFRTVGEASGDTKADILSDRASDTLDPMTSLRSDVLYVFLEKKLSHIQRQNELDLAHAHEHPHLLRQATIVKTVGGSAHGYIHCSLCRLALAPELTKQPVNWKLLHRLCRSWTAKLTGRRMAVRAFTLSEMTGLGQGRNKNPFDKALPGYKKSA
ncbi:unnamed protein product [Durusdinium trenchii]|uniref:Uncharacterized protein n=1 Tax=Durusdinium trenchii TaxID=1381693 RepID=A0ABP0JT30_9DINO